MQLTNLLGAKSMKNVITLSVLIGVLTIIILGCGIDSEDEVRDLGPVQFVSVDPPSGSTLLSNATLTVSFSGVPKDLIVTQGVVSLSARTATISGPFAVGALHLTITWEGGVHTLVYEVKPVPVNFVSVNPPSGSLLLPDATLTVSFNGVPKHLRVTPGKVHISGRIATISGPFPRGRTQHRNEMGHWSTHARLYSRILSAGGNGTDS